MFTLEQLTEELGAVVGELDPCCYSGDDAAHLTEVAARGERLFAAAKLMFARRAAETRGWARRSHAATPEQWLGLVSGCSEAAAHEVLRTAERLDDLPHTAEELRAGTLSVPQAAQVSAAAGVDPNAEAGLLDVAHRDGMRGLRAAKERIVAAATDERAAHDLAVRERHVRTWTRGLATHGSFSGPTEDVAELLAALQPLERSAFDAARAEQRREPRDAYRFDALISLARDAGMTSGTVTKRRPPATRIRIGLQSLLDGAIAPGEVCEIPGVGPVPVAHARRVLGNGLLELVITDGIDVRTVVSTTRHVPAPLKIAVAERDQTCRVRGCDADHNLELHHVEPFAASHLTSYANTGMVCPAHHDLITYKGSVVIENDDGSWSLRAPPDTEAA